MAEMTTAQKLALAIQHHNAGEFDSAAKLCREILAADPQHADAINLLGIIDFFAGRLQPALEKVRRAVELNGDNAGYHYNEGQICGNLGRTQEAIAAFRQAISLQENLADAWLGLGMMYRLEKKPEEMLQAFTRAAELRPERAHWQGALAGHLAAHDRIDEAIAAYRRAIAVQPDFAEAHLNLGNTLKDTGRLDEALECFDRALQSKPSYSEALVNRLNTIHFHVGFGPEEILAETRKFEEIFALPLAPEIQPHTNDRSADRRLRIGYVSPDFRDHVVGRNVLPVLRRHDKSKFEIFCYASVYREDEITGQFRSAADVWRNIVNVGDAEVAKMIRDDEIDILVDLGMYLAHSRPLVFARKPAPVQVAFAAYPGTTGLSAIDYRLTDPYLDPNGRDEFYSEKSIRLPHSFWCFDPLEVDAPVNRLPAMDAGYITFGCLNNFCKVTDRTLELWAKVLREVPDSRLILQTKTGRHRERILSKLGIDPDRVEFSLYLPRPKYLRLYHRIDLGLDTFPYNGHTTSLDSLWMGVPVVSLCGQTVASRAGFSQSSNLGLADQLVAETDERFVELAVNLARDLPRLSELRRSLRVRMEKSPLMDAAGFARGIEAAYSFMWQTWISSR
jgi:predicted O-linked N-acetylglucosamine transferase (SPINDLY family)